MTIQPDPVELRRAVRAFCPRCHTDDPNRPLDEVARLNGRLVDSGGSVWLIRHCPTHGEITTLYEEDAALLDWLERWTAPTKPPTPDSPDDLSSAPGCYRRGLGGSQIQHTCILVEDITAGCNLRCPTCFVAAAPEALGRASIGEVLVNIDRRLELEGGRLDVVMLSGGEPTIHPEFIPMLREIVDRDIVRILINTNGVAVARDDLLLDTLAELRGRVEVYLQFDGFDPEAHRRLRGADLSEIKQRAVRRLSEAEVFTTLVMTAAKGINDREIGPVLQLAMDTPFIGGVAYQPVFSSGRSESIDPLDRLTGTGTLRRIEQQTGGLVRGHDLTALPCSHPHCATVGFLFRLPRRRWRSLVSLVGAERLEANVGLVANRVVDPELDDALTVLTTTRFSSLLSERNSLTHPDVAEILVEVLEHGDRGVKALLRAVAMVKGRGDGLRRLLGKRVKRVTIKPFMDIHTMIEERLLQCCVHAGAVGKDGRHQAAPFCASQAWPSLARLKLGSGFSALDRG